MAETTQSKLDFLSKKEIQFIAWIVAVIMGIAVPFITYGNKIESLEQQVSDSAEVRMEIIEKLNSIQVDQAVVKNDVGHIKESIDEIKQSLLSQ